MKSAHIPILGTLALLFATTLAAQGPLTFDEDAEAQILGALNLSRAEEGVLALKFDPALRDAARRHTVLLVQHNTLSHRFPGEPPLTERLGSAGLFFTTAAENVGLNSQLEDVNHMFLRSPGHRANMLNPGYNAVGIGVVHRGRDWWVTEDFAQLAPSLSVQQVEDEAAASFQLKWKQTHAGVPKRIDIEALRASACETARSGGQLRKSNFTYQGRLAREVVGFSTPDPSALATQVDSIINSASVSAYAVGACTPQQAESGGQFWIIMAFF